MTIESRPILIIGAGVSGLCLAEGLRKNTKIPFRIFERDPSLHARSQGYRVRVSGEGIEALRHNLPSDRFDRLRANACAFVHYGSTHNSIDHIVDGMTGGLGQLANTWKADAESKAKFHNHLGDADEKDDKPLAVDRTVLREVMYEGLADVVEFNKNLVHYDLLEDDTVRAAFKDGTTVEGSALIGSDGCWSHTRRQLLPKYSLKDSEARVIWGKAELTDEFVAALPPLARDGLGLFVTPDLKVLFESMRFDRSSAHADVKLMPKDYFYYLCYPRKDALNGLNDEQFLYLSNDEAGNLAKRLTKDWETSAQVPFQRVTPHAASVSRIPTATPDLPTWDAQGPVTLMGDAVHSSKREFCKPRLRNMFQWLTDSLSVAPTAALGATTALRDSYHLARELEKLSASPSPTDIEGALRQYEKHMRVYAAQALEFSAAGGRAVFGFRGFENIPEIELHD